MIKLSHIISEIKLLSTISPEMVEKLYNKLWRIKNWDPLLRFEDLSVKYYGDKNGYIAHHKGSLLDFFKMISKDDLKKYYNQLLSLEKNISKF